MKENNPMGKKERKRQMENPGPPTQSRPIVIENVLRALVLFLGVLFLGFLLINQGLGFFYKTEFLKGPCNVCLDLNPGVKECITNLNAERPSYWTPNGWTDPFNTSTPYQINITP